MVLTASRGQEGGGLLLQIDGRGAHREAPALGLDKGMWGPLGQCVESCLEGAGGKTRWYRMIAVINTSSAGAAAAILP